MFPFRNYDQWAISALHQVSYREGEVGCHEAELLLDECKPHRYKLDFDKYTKAILKTFVHSFSWVRNNSGDERVKDHHYMLLYDYLFLDKTLGWLADDNYGVPKLPGTERKINSASTTLENGHARVQLDPCREEANMMEKYHRCFSDELAFLY